MKPMLRATAISAFSCACFNFPEAMAETRVTYTSEPLDWESATLYGDPDDIGSDRSPVFSISFTMPWEISSVLAPQQFIMPLPQLSYSEDYGQYTVHKTRFQNDFTVAPGGTVTDWNFGLFTSPLYQPDDDILKVMQTLTTRIFSSKSVDALEVRFNQTTYLSGMVPFILGPVQVNYLNVDTPGEWTVASVSPIPEPETWGMMLGGLAMVGWMARRTRQSGRAARC